MHLPHDSPFSLSLSDGDSRWGLTEQLLAQIADDTRAGNWQRAGKSTLPRPKPIPRPGVKAPEETFGGKSRTYSRDEMRELLDRYTLGVN